MIKDNHNEKMLYIEVKGNKEKGKILSNKILKILIVSICLVMFFCINQIYAQNVTPKVDAITTCIDSDIKLLKNISKNDSNYVDNTVVEIKFNSENLLEISNVTEEQLIQLLENTNLKDLSSYYIEAEKLYGVNALFLVGLTAQESGWGTSDRAIYDNNLTGFGVYDAYSEGINAPTKRDNIIETAKWLRKEYLSEDGRHFNGFSVIDVNKCYCLDTNGKIDYLWSENITLIANDLLERLQ